MIKGEVGWVELRSREHKGGWERGGALEWRRGEAVELQRGIGNQARGSSAPEILFAIQLPPVHTTPLAVPTSQLPTAPNAPN